MVPARHRLRASADFTATVRARGGAKAGSRLVVVHARRTDARAGKPPRVGFTVSKAVGTAVVRNRTTRRLRAQVAQRLGRVPDGIDIVVRATPAAAGATSADLGRQLDRTLTSVLARLRERSEERSR